MGLQDVLSASADAVEELRSSLEEESLSRIEVEGGVARFTVRSEDGTAYLFSATFLGSLLPCGASLSCSRTVQGLDKANGKLGVSSTLTRAVAAAGRCVGVDLDWVAEAEAEGNGSDEEMQDADDLVDSDAGSDGEEDELLREWSKRLVKVEKIERGIEEREAYEEAAGDLDALQQRQIFDSRAAFRRLANELEEVFKSHDFNLVAEAAEEPDGLYRWHVTLGGFDPESPLAQDMREAGRRFGSSSVQLQLVFKRPLHPFYPPSVQLVSPRFQGPILSAVASHPLFSIKGWDPTCSARDALLLLKAFLEKNARVDFDSARNAAGPFAYLPVEVLLAKLEALTGTAAAAQSLQQYQGMYRMREEQAAQKDGIPSPVAQQQQPAKKQKAGNGTAAAWKAGVGYGHSDRDGGSVWDAKKAEAVQAARDRELGDVLEGLARELAANLAPGASPADLADCTAAVHQSCLAPYVAHQLSAASFQDMAARHRFYRSLLQCAEALCSPQTASLLSWHSAESCRSIASAIAGLESQVSHFVRVYKQAQAAQAAAGTGSSRGAAAESEEDKAELELANYLLALAVKVSAAAPVAPAAGDAAAAGGAAAAAAAEAGGEAQAGAAAPETSVEEAYRLRLSPYRVRIADGVAANHKHREAARGEVLQPKLRARRVGRELASCESDLPVSASSSVFVVADEANSNLWKALITGPEGTPYCGGCFLFDIYFPPDYPRIPPRVDIRTTGGGSVRFNPNLYQDGKVCLSLLGTWRGGRGESWSAEYSTVLQVLISIQSLILVDEPWYNEPGYEQRADDANSNRYSAQLMPHTIKWAMLDQLQHGPEYFQHVIREHFRLRGDYILGNCRRWVEWCREKGQAGSAREVEKQLAALEAELSKLKAQPS